MAEQKRDYYEVLGIDKSADDAAIKKASEEYEKYCRNQLNEPTEVEKHFIEMETEIKKLKDENSGKNRIIEIKDNKKPAGGDQ